MSQKTTESTAPDFGYAGTAVRVAELGVLCYGLAEADNGKLWIAAIGAVALGATVLSELVVEVMHTKRQSNES
jgi:hypothetical protein